MSVFKLEKGKVVIDMDIISNTPPYVALWEQDRSEGKEETTAKFRLIFHMHDPRSQYQTSATDGRFNKIITDLFPNLVEWEKKADKDKVYQAAAKYYLHSLMLIPERALLEAAQDAVHELADDIKKKDTKDKIDKMGKMRKAMEDLQAVKDMVAKDEEKARETKGKNQIKRREDPEYYQNKQTV